MIGALLIAPLTTLAHDGDHVVTAWYQDPYTIGLLVVGLATLGLLGYGFFAKKRSFTTIPTIALVMIAVIGLTGLGQNSTPYEPQLAVADFGAGDGVKTCGGSLFGSSTERGCYSLFAKACRKALVPSISLRIRDFDGGLDQKPGCRGTPRGD